MTKEHRQHGDGPQCPEPGDHGSLYFVHGNSGKEMLWCPVSQELFAVADGGHAVGKALRVKVDHA